MADPVTLGIPAAVLLHELVVRNALGEYAGSPIEGERKQTRRDYKRMMRNMGVDPKTPLVITKDSPGSSAFIPAENADMARELLSKRDLAQARKRGAIVLGGGSNSAVAAHEAGHAADYQKNKKSFWPYAIGGVAPAVGALGGVATGLVTGNPYLGAGVGGLLGVGVGGRMLWDEFQASRKADDEVSKDEKKKWPSRNRLGAAYLTYLGTLAVPGIAGGALLGHIASRGKGWSNPTKIGV